MKPLVYLACPYSDRNPCVREERFGAANKAAGELMKAGYYVFSPISHTHPIAMACALPQGWEYWSGFDRAYLEHCNKVFVLCIPGWEKSVGVTAEIGIANELGLPIEYIGAAQDIAKSSAQQAATRLEPEALMENGMHPVIGLNGEQI